MSSAVDGPAGDAFVSTGELPERALVQSLVREAHDRYRANRDGENSQAYPALASVPADLFGVCVVGTSGATVAAGDADHEFTIMSVSKPFVFALVCELIGPDDGARTAGSQQHRAAVQLALRGRAVGRRPDESHGQRGGDRDHQPGRGETVEERWRFIHDGLSRFAGRELSLDDEVYASASASNSRNQSIARLLESFDRLYCPSARCRGAVHTAVLPARDAPETLP